MRIRALSRSIEISGIPASNINENKFVIKFACRLKMQKAIVQ
uniref:Uncharacterized protein n=1 Tax=Meloidogyne enterolobii TaxID=390850 RepID=A0A6V7XWB4_MELEN|nr:unnamed protein product [Meloidogyne enterolobii]